MNVRRAMPNDEHSRSARGFLDQLREHRQIWKVALIIAVCDQATKALVRSILPLNTSVEVVPGLLNLTHIRNTGAAFGFLNNVDIPLKAAVMTAVSAVALMAILIYGTLLPTAERTARIGLALIVGGAIGNLIDRAVAGYVVDFVDVYWRDYHFWAFNVADSAITVGASVMILDMLLQGRYVSKAS